MGLSIAEKIWAAHASTAISEPGGFIVATVGGHFGVLGGCDSRRIGAS